MSTPNTWALHNEDYQAQQLRISRQTKPTNSRARIKAARKASRRRTR